MIPIDKGVPVPARTSNNKYRWREMEVGDSFFVAGHKAANMRSAMQNAENKHGAKFTVRSVTEKGVRGARVWRVA